jgi:ParB family chromosome partitioning protein
VTESSSSGKKRGLGRGLGALIMNTGALSPASDETPHQPAGGGVLRMAVEHISPNPHQPRSLFDPLALEELAASIRTHGILQPLIVTANLERPGDYWIVAGERRWRAAQLAGVHEVPVLVREATPQQLLEWALVENVQRADLNALEEAAAYQTLVERFALTQAEIGDRVGKSRAAVANTLRLLQLPAPLQQALIDARISAGHARALLALPDPETMLATLDRITARGLNVRQTEELVRQILLRAAAPPVEANAPRDPHLTQLENRFRAALGTRVQLARNADGAGRLIVHFYNDDDLEALYQLLTAHAGAEE